MSVKILHAADFHLDSPFEALPPELAAVRRREQRDLLDRIAGLAEDEGVQLVLLSGDLLDSGTSYHETQEVLVRTFERISAEIFIAPGNHDYYCPKSPYAYVRFPENVHIFTSPLMGCCTLPQLGCRIWGAGFNGQHSRPLLPGFSVPDSTLLDIMVLHGDTAGDVYNRIREADIAASGLDYLALGHIHTFSGVRQAGRTSFAYPGCPEGRGFDETGDKGVLVGTVSKSGCDLRFVPMAGRAYKIYSADLTACGAEGGDPAAAVAAQLPQVTGRDICRVILAGEYGGPIDLQSIREALAGRFFHLTLQDQTHPPRDLWEGAGDDTLRGIFLRIMKERYDGADDSAKATILLAVRYGLAALVNAEEYGS